VPIVVAESLRAYGIEVVPTSEVCASFTGILSRFVEGFCDYYDREITTQLNDPGNSKTLLELRSWANSEVLEILFLALGTFSERVAVREELLLHVQRITCAQALSYFVWLVDAAESARAQRLAARSIPPSTARHRSKRDSHPWTPYGVDVAFDTIKRALGLK